MQADSNSAPAGPVLWEETVPGGAHWSGVMRRGTALRFTDIEGGANLSALFWNFEEKSERYNMPDTLKAQHTAFLTRGHCGFSDMGRVLLSITHERTIATDPCPLMSLSPTRIPQPRVWSDTCGWVPVTTVASMVA